VNLIFLRTVVDFVVDEIPSDGSIARKFGLLKRNLAAPETVRVKRYDVFHLCIKLVEIFTERLELFVIKIVKGSVLIMK